MKVSHLSELMGHFGKGIDSAGAGGIAKELSLLSQAMQPFADRTVADFVKFLNQCEEFQRTGAVSGGSKRGGGKGAAGADSERVSRAVVQLKQLLDEARRQDVAQARIEEAVDGLKPLSKGELDEVVRQMEIQPRPKSKADALQKIRDTISMQAEISARVELSSQGF